MRVPATLGDIDAAAVRLRRAAASFLHGDILDCFEIATVEALTNIVRHAYQDAPKRLIDVKLVTIQGGLALQLRDTGRPANAGFLPFPDGAAQDNTGLDRTLESGRGLALIRRCANEVEYRPGPGGNQLRLVFRHPLYQKEGSSPCI
jgi:serine/threonine-protein kinase RsbW